MQRLTVIWILFVIWAALYAASFILPYNTAPTGDGFVRGMNRLMLFFQFQIGAGLVAVVVWVMGRAFQKGTWQRWLSRGPALLAIGLLLVVVGVIVAANWNKPGPGDIPYTPPATEAAPALEQ